MTRTQRIAGLVALVGIIVGLLAAVLVPRTTQGQASGPTPFRALPGPIVEAPMLRRDLRPYGRMSPTIKVTRGSVRTELRRPDPAGGPTWVIRSFEATESYPPVPGGPVTKRRATTHRCLQLGRERGGRFGWVDGDNAFRPVPTRTRISNLSLCGHRELARRKAMDLSLTTLVGHPTRDDRSILGSVLWGTTGQPIEQLTLRAAGRTTTVEQGSGGAFLEFYGPDRSPSDAFITRRYAGGKVKRQALFENHFLASMRKRMEASMPKLRPETHQIAARAPDPGGGPSQGLAAIQTVDGHWCAAEQGPIVGNRIGQIEPVHGTLFEQDTTMFAGGCSKDAYPPGQAITLGSGYVGAQDQEPLDPGRAALRLQPGRSAMYGLARSDVELITFASPRDVRTIAPSGPAHAFIVAWDGDFAASGSVRITTHLKDGTTRTMTENLTW